MTKKIFRSILAAACAVLLSSFCLIIGCMYNYFTSVSENNLKTQLDMAAAGVEQNGASYLEQIKDGDFRLTWIAADGTVMYDTAVDEGQTDNHMEREEVKAAFSAGFGTSVRYSNTLLEKTIYCAKKLTDGTVLRISASTATVGSLLMGALQSMLIVISFAVVLSGIIAGNAARRIVKPLNEINLEHPLENDVYEEISPLLNRINRQQLEMEKQMKELRRKSDEFSQIIGAMNEGLVLLDDEGTVLSMNSAAGKIFGTDEDMTGRSVLNLCREKELEDSIKAAVETGSSEYHQERNGSVYQFDISPIASESENIGVVILIFDITEKVQAERNRQEFTAIVSHELKTPLQGIIGSAELIENGMVSEEDLPVFVGHIRKEASRMVTLVEDIIRLSQLDEKSQLHRENVDLFDLAEECTEQLAPVAAGKNVKISLYGQHIHVQGVSKLLEEIVFNLCDNAVKYNNDGGHVNVDISKNGENAVLTVEDTGIGIPDEDQEKIFQRFYRVDKSRSKETGGTGLGLSIVKHAVACHKGKITLRSKPGKGTKITVELPCK